MDASFDECFQMAPKVNIEGVEVPYLHINHLLANKKAVQRPKDLGDIDALEKIKKLRDQ